MSSQTSNVRPWVQALREVFSFPHPVNEVAARMVAGMVVAVSLVAILLVGIAQIKLIPPTM